MDTVTLSNAAGGEGEVLVIRGSARRLIRRVLEGKLRTAEAGEYDLAREELARYAHDPKTSPSEKRKALEALLRDEGVGVAAARTALEDGQAGAPVPVLVSQVIVLGAEHEAAVERLLERAGIVQPALPAPAHTNGNGHARNGNHKG